MAKFDPGEITPKALGLNCEGFDVLVEDSVQLKGWFVGSADSTFHGTVILLHGIASCKESIHM